MAERSDEELLAERRPDRAGPAFEAFYVRHERALLAYFRRRVADAETAADLTAETFAQALLSRERYRPRAQSTAVGWLFGIAGHVLARSRRRGAAEDRARRRLELERPVLDDEQREAIDELGTAPGLLAALEALPAEQREAVRLRVLADLPYAEIASGQAVSQAVVRKRVSRGLAALRRDLEELS